MELGNSYEKNKIGKKFRPIVFNNAINHEEYFQTRPAYESKFKLTIISRDNQDIILKNILNLDNALSRIIIKKSEYR